MEQTNELLNGKISSALLKFAAPFLVASFLQAFYGAVDLFVVGQYTGSAAVSAVSIGSQVMQTITGIILGISTGGTVLIARRIGENNLKRAASAVGNLAIVFAVLACILTPAMLVFHPTAVSLMQTPPEAVADARNYIFICSCGIPFIIGYNAVSGIFRGIGDSKTPVYFIVIACVVNIAGDFLLSGWLKLGAPGAAIATVTAQMVSFLSFLIYMKKKGLPFAFGRSDIRFRKNDAAAILKVGFPLALQDALVNISFLAITAIVNTLGLTASAAVGVAEKIMGFAFLPAGAFAAAVATMSAQNLGAGKPRRARSSYRCGILYALVFGVAVCVFAQLFPNVLPGVFSRDEAVITAAGQYMRSYTIDCILVSFVFCTNSYFNSYGKSLISFIHSMIATFGVRIPATYFLSRYATDSLYVMGLAAPAASLVSIIICCFFLRGLHKNIAFSHSS
ncbi:MAG: MATE family efflux transporter [Lachnospiraceae bacterium]|nr:MATE family efflux transporter [Lachnospiraceae bacterium]